MAPLEQLRRAQHRHYTRTYLSQHSRTVIFGVEVIDTVVHQDGDANHLH